MEKKHDATETRITVRFPASLIEDLRPLARGNMRSLNGEIVRAVSQYIERQQQEAAKKQSNA